jgi:ubiquinone/menaquinone biosynthesis C-methylase UbiE
MNRYHRRYCRSAAWAERLETAVLPWVVGDADLGSELLEVGPGPGLTTDSLRRRVQKLTAIEIDDRLAATLEARMAGTNVSVVRGDATAMPFEDGRFDSAVSLTMLHHVPSAEQQDRLIAEVARVLKPGGRFLGFDSTVSLKFRLVHLFDTMVVVDPDTFGTRLERAGFDDPKVSTSPNGGFRFRATKAA